MGFKEDKLERFKRADPYLKEVEACEICSADSLDFRLERTRKALSYMHFFEGPLFEDDGSTTFIIVAQGTPFHVHKDLLCSESDFFKFVYLFV